MTEDILIFDDVLPKSLADKIENDLLGNYFPWYFLDDISYPGQNLEQEKTTAGFSHYFFDNGEIVSEWFDSVKELPNYINNRVNIKYFEILQVRTFLQLAQPNSRLHDNIHVDRKIPHIVFLYYVNDSSGETFIFGKNKSDEISKKIVPKKNRVVVFDGSLYHASSQPKSGKRCIINYNVINCKF